MERSSLYRNVLVDAARTARRLVSAFDQAQLAATAAACGLTLLAWLLSTAFDPAGLHCLWPLAGVAVGILAVATRTTRGPVALGIASSLLLAGLLERRAAVPALMSLVLLLLEGGLAGVLLSHIGGGSFALDRRQSVAAFVAVAMGAPALVGVAATLALPLAEIGSQSLATPSWLELWWSWTGPHALGILTVAPAVIGLGRSVAAGRDWPDPVAVLAGALIVLIMVGGSLLPATSTAALLLLLLAPLIGWVLLRASPGNVATALLAIAAVALRQSANDTGIFADAHLSGQVLVGALAIVLLALGALRPPQGEVAMHDGRSLRRQGDIRALVVIAPILLFACAGWWEFFDVDTEAKARGDRKLNALVEHAHRVIEVQEAMLEAALARVSGRSAEEIEADPRLTAFLDQLVSNTETSKALFLVRLDTGRVLATSQAFPAPHLDHSQREYIGIHRQTAQRTVIGEIGQALPHVEFGFTVSRLDSSSGVVAGSHLPLEEFQRFYSQLREGDRDVMNLLRDDGALLARQRKQVTTPGMRLSPRVISMRLLRGELTGPVVSRGTFDGVTRQFQARKVASFPVHVVYGQDYARIRTAWLRQLMPIGMLAFLTSSMLYRLTDRLQRTAADAEAARSAVRSQRSLAELNERLSFAMRAAGAGAWELELGADRGTWSPECYHLFGLDAADGVPTVAEWRTRVVHPDDLDKVQREVDTLRKGSSGTLHYDFRIRHPKHGLRWIATHGQLKQTDGLPPRIVGLFLDITERKRAEAALRESEERLRLSTDAAGIGTFSMDLLTGQISYSPELAQMLGVPGRVEVSLEEALARVHRNDLADVRTRLAATTAPSSDGRLKMEFRFVRPGGVVRWMTWNGGVTFRDRPQGREAVRILGACTDITERKLAEEALRASEARMRLAARAAGIGFWEMDLATGQVRGSAEYFGLFGLPATTEPVPVERIWEKYHPEDQARLLAEGDDIGRPAARDRRIVLPDGRVRWVHVARDVRRDAAGKPVIRHGATIDITERKEAEQLLARSRAELERRVAERTADLEREMQKREEVQAKLAQVQRLDAVGRLAGGLAHDYNNALAVIAANIELAEPYIQDAKARRGMQAALDVVVMSASLNRRLLTFARGGKLNAERVDVGGHVRGIVGVLEKALGGSAVVAADLSPGTWPARLDPGELTSAILNLAINARDAMPEGGSLVLGLQNVSLTAAELSPGCDAMPGDYVRLSMRDTGTGMAREVAQRAIEPFYSTKDRASNSGLGLSSVAEFVRASAGFLTIDSAVGRGTTVSLFLPRDLSNEPGAQTDGASPEVPLGDGELVMLIDDNERLLEVTQALLEGLGYAVLTAGSGPQAFELLELGEPVDLVLSDIVMPGKLSGYDVARRLRSEYPEIKVVLASGHFDEETAGGDAALGNYKVLRKPYSRAVLARTLSAALAGSRQPADLAGERVTNPPDRLDQGRLLE